MMSGLDASLIPPEELWIVITAFVIAFVLAFAVGANDVANAFGTSVGSKVISLRTACIMGTIFETSGALLIGSKVSSTIRKSIVDMTYYADNPELLMLGQLSSLIGCAIWLLVATFFKLPVSTTHSIVGATVGFTLVVNGPDSVKWAEIVKIAISWVASPALSGAMSVLLFWLCRTFIIRMKPNPLEAGLRALPLIYALTVAINVFSIILSGPPVLAFDKIPLWGNFVASFGLGLVISIIVKTVFVPRQRISVKKFLRSQQNEAIEMKEVGKVAKVADEVASVLSSTAEAVASGSKDSRESSASSKSKKKNSGRQQKNDDGDDDKPVVSFQIAKADSDAEEESSAGVTRRHAGADNKAFANEAEAKDEIVPAPSTDGNTQVAELAKEDWSVRDPPAVARLFSFCQVLTAAFISFAHGGNDVANSIGPLIGIWVMAITDTAAEEASTPLWILLYGGVGMSIGLWVWGRRVMETIGSSLTIVTPSSGFTINFGAAVTVLIASNIGIPISTTHCIVGSVVSVGRFRSKDNIDWKLFINILLSWVITLPAAIGLSALTMFILVSSFPQYK